jgi:hypothetical protein
MVSSGTKEAVQVNKERNERKCAGIGFQNLIFIDEGK